MNATTMNATTIMNANQGVIKGNNGANKAASTGGEIKTSILGKRNYNDAFGTDSYDDGRYGQHIGADFFETNVGHAPPVYSAQTLQAAADSVIIDFRTDLNSMMESLNREKVGEKSNENVEDILSWCEYYLANKNLFNV